MPPIPTLPLRSQGLDRRQTWRDLAIPVLLALIQVILQVAFHDRYGYFRDELYYLACSDRLDWGYVDHPPFSIALLWASRALLGDSLQAIWPEEKAYI